MESALAALIFCRKHAYLNRRIDFADLFGSLLCFGHADIRGVGQGLTVQIGFVENVSVNHCQKTDPDAGQQQDNRSPQPTGTDNGHSGVCQLQLIFQRKDVAVAHVAMRPDALPKRSDVDVAEVADAALRNLEGRVVFNNHDPALSRIGKLYRFIPYPFFYMRRIF